MIVMSDLDDALIMCDLDRKHISLKIYVDLMIDLTMLELMRMLVPSMI